MGGPDLQAIGATDPSEELAEFLRQAREVDFSLSAARSHHHGLIQINDFSHMMVHNPTGVASRGADCRPAAAGRQRAAAAGHLQSVLGGWRAPRSQAA